MYLVRHMRGTASELGLTSLCQILQYDRQMKANVNYTRRSVY